MVRSPFQIWKRSQAKTRKPVWNFQQHDVEETNESGFWICRRHSNRHWQDSRHSDEWQNNEWRRRHRWRRGGGGGNDSRQLFIDFECWTCRKEKKFGKVLSKLREAVVRQVRLWPTRLPKSWTLDSIHVPILWFWWWWSIQTTIWWHR